jgi:hypothetical protein
MGRETEMAVLDRKMVKGTYGYLAMGVFSLLVGVAML